MSAILAAVASLFGVLVIAAVGDAVSEEVRTRLDRFPFVIIRLAIRRVPNAIRSDLAAEWESELQYILRGAEGMPITRLLRGIRFASGLVRTAPEIADSLLDVRSDRSASAPTTPVRPRWPYLHSRRAALREPLIDLAPGSIMSERDLRDRFDVDPRTDVVLSSSTPNIFVLVSQRSMYRGKASNGWRSDCAFHLVGEGRLGDQTFTGGNLELRRHVANGRAIQLFEKLGSNKVQYAGQFLLDRRRPYYRATDRDKKGKVRSVILFRLWPSNRGLRESRDIRKRRPDAWLR